MTVRSKESIGVAVITHGAKKHLAHCLPPLLNSPLKPRVLVMNSSSNDGTVEEAQRLGADVLVIPRPSFNHGSTRERARQELNTDIVVMITPDAYALDNSLIEKLIAPIQKRKAVVSYARQISHDGADIFESFPRDFNYPAESQLRGIKDVDKYGVYTYFCSDSCSAYRNAALDEIGGFTSTLTSEDAIATAKFLRRGYKIAYVADAVVKHSHRYTLKQEFCRYFDTGYGRKQNKELFSFGGKDSARGQDYLREFLKAVKNENSSLIPYAIIQTAAKWLGYRVGTLSLNAPLWFKKALSSQDFYWVSDDFLKENDD